MAVFFLDAARTLSASHSKAGAQPTAATLVICGLPWTLIRQCHAMTSTYPRWGGLSRCKCSPRPPPLGGVNQGSLLKRVSFLFGDTADDFSQQFSVLKKQMEAIKHIPPYCDPAAFRPSRSWLASAPQQPRPSATPVPAQVPPLRQAPMYKEHRPRRAQEDPGNWARLQPLQLC